MIFSKYKNRVWFVVLQIMLLFFMLITCIFHNLSLYIGINYFLFQLLCILLPGYAAYHLWGVKSGDCIVALSISYALGLSLLLVEYLILAIFKAQTLSFPLSFLLFLSSAIYIFKKHKEIKLDSTNFNWILCITFIFLILILDLLTVSFVNTIPNEIDINGYYVDWLFWIGNNISFTKGFPPQDYRLCGESFNYHYFSSILLAQSSKITSINITVLSFYFSFFIPAILLVSAAYTLFSKLIKKKEFLFLALFIVLFTEGSSLTYIWHIYFCPFGYDYGYIFGMLSIYELLKLKEQGNLSIKEAILSGLLVAMTTGCKGPVGIVVLIGFGIAAVDYIFQKNYKKGMLLGCIWLGAFLIVYFLFISGKVTASDSGLKFLGVSKAFKLNPFAQPIFLNLKSIYGFPDNKITKIISLILYIYNINKASILLFLVALGVLIYLLFQKKFDLTLAITTAICIWGIILTITTKQVGGSEMYFVMSIIPFGIGGGFYAIESISRIKYCYLNFLLAAVIIAGYLNFSSFCALAYPRARQGILCKNNQLDKSNHQIYYATRTDLEAYEWLKNNTKEDDIIAIDSIFDSNGQTLEMVAGVFSERYIWNDGKYSANKEEVKRRKDIIERLLSGEFKAAKELTQNGVDFFLQNLQVNPSFYLDDAYGVCIYENSNFRVYKLIN